MKHLSSLIAAALLVATPFAASATDMVVIMGPGAAAMSKEQIANIYLGRNFELTTYDLPEGSSARDQFYKRATERDSSQIKAVWSRVVFTAKGRAPLEVANSAAVKSAVIANPKAIGYIEKSALDASVTAILPLPE